MVVHLCNILQVQCHDTTRLRCLSSCMLTMEPSSVAKLFASYGWVQIVPRITTDSSPLIIEADLQPSSKLILEIELEITIPTRAKPGCWFRYSFAVNADHGSMYIHSNDAGILCTWYVYFIVGNSSHQNISRIRHMCDCWSSCSLESFSRGCSSLESLPLHCMWHCADVWELHIHQCLSGWLHSQWLFLIDLYVTLTQYLKKEKGLPVVNPSCLQATFESVSDQSWLQTGLHTLNRHTSRLPSYSTTPPVSLRSPSIHPSTVVLLSSFATYLKNNNNML